MCFSLSQVCTEHIYSQVKTTLCLRSKVQYVRAGMEGQRFHLNFLTFSVGFGIKSPSAHQEPAWILYKRFSLMVHGQNLGKKDREEVIERTSTLSNRGLRGQEKGQKKTLSSQTRGRFSPGMRRCVMIQWREGLQPSLALRL